MLKWKLYYNNTFFYQKITKKVHFIVRLQCWDTFELCAWSCLDAHTAPHLSTEGVLQLCVIEGCLPVTLTCYWTCYIWHEHSRVMGYSSQHLATCSVNKKATQGSLNLLISTQHSTIQQQAHFRIIMGIGNDVMLAVISFLRCGEQSSLENDPTSSLTGFKWSSREEANFLIWSIPRESTDAFFPLYHCINMKIGHRLMGAIS